MGLVADDQPRGLPAADVVEFVRPGQLRIRDDVERSGHVEVVGVNLALGVVLVSKFSGAKHEHPARVDSEHPRGQVGHERLSHPDAHRKQAPAELLDPMERGRLRRA